MHIRGSERSFFVCFRGVHTPASSPYSRVTFTLNRTSKRKAAFRAFDVTCYA